MGWVQVMTPVKALVEQYGWDVVDTAVLLRSEVGSGQGPHSAMTGLLVEHSDLCRADALRVLAGVWHCGLDYRYRVPGLSNVYPYSTVPVWRAGVKDGAKP